MRSVNEAEDDVSLPRGRRRQQHREARGFHESLSGYERIPREGYIGECDRREKGKGKSLNRPNEQRKEDMSAVESALDVLSRAATMVQGQFTLFGIPRDLREL